MKLLFVLEDFTLGGVERVTLQLIKGLLSEYNVEIAATSQCKRGPLLKDFEDITTVCDSASKLNSFKTLIQQYKPTIVIFTKGGLSKLAVVLPKHCKTVAIQHVPIQLPEESWVKNVIRRVGATLLYRKMDKVVCVSDGIFQNLIKLGVCSKSNTTRIYNPVLSENILTLADQAMPEYEDYYVCVGRLHYQKGYDLLLESLIKLGKPTCKVVILGNGPDKAKLEALIKKYNLESQVILHGVTSNPYMYIKHAKAILLPSRWEGLPTVLVEASYLKTPIIAFDCRYGPKELTRNGLYGYLVPFGDTTQFASYIDLIEQGVLKASVDTEEFTLKSSVQNYYKLFKSL